MKNGMYYSQTENRIAYLYEQPREVTLTCDCCGRDVPHPTCCVWEDDDEGIEYVYGIECIKMFKFKRIKEA